MCWSLSIQCKYFDTGFSPRSSVGLSVCPESILWQNGEWIRMPFGVVSAVGRGMGVLDGVVSVEKEGAVLGMNLGRPTVTNGLSELRDSDALFASYFGEDLLVLNVYS